MFLWYWTYLTSLLSQCFIVEEGRRSDKERLRSEMFAKKTLICCCWLTAIWHCRGKRRRSDKERLRSEVFAKKKWLLAHCNLTRARPWRGSWKLRLNSILKTCFLHPNSIGLFPIPFQTLNPTFPRLHRSIRIRKLF